MVLPVDNPRADPDRDIFSNAFPHPLKIFQRRRYAAGGAPRGAPRARNARLVEKNGFEPGFEPPFWDILADMGGRPAIKKQLVGWP